VRVQLLKPRAKKLTLVDARRVMCVYEETTRRVQLVSGLLEQTSISAAVKRLSLPLGAELVDALSQYSSVLDIFDEVVSWREMAMCDIRSPLPLPPPPSSAGVDRDSVVLTQEDSIFVMLFKTEDDLVELVPESESSTLFQARSLS